MRSTLAAIQIVATLGFMATAPASAQSPSVPRSDTPQSESTGSQDPRSTGSTARPSESLSERLNETGGVIRPPENIAPDMAIRPLTLVPRG